MSGSQVLSLAGWAFLPNLVTGWLQSLWYSLTIRAGSPRPTPGTPRYNAHRRRIHIAVVSAYLLYTIYEADYDLLRTSDFYTDLGVSHSASDRDIKTRFRRLAALYHPDKVSGSNAGAAADEFFRRLRTAQDTLTNPVKRFAYDRFGAESTEWQRCSSVRDYVVQGLTPIGQYYGAMVVFTYFLGLLGYLDWGKYWRWVMIAVLCIFELHTVSRPFFPPVASKVINPLLTTFTSHPPYLPFQLIQLVRKIAITVYIAFGQIGPLLQTPEQAMRQGDPEVALRQQLMRLEQTTKAADVETSRLMDLERAPFVGDVEALREVQLKIRDWLVQNTIRMDPMVRDAVGKVFQRKRADAPAGARGTR